MSNTREGRCRIAHWAAQADPVVSAQLAFELMTTDLRQAIGALTVPATVLSARDPAMGSAEEIDALWQSNSAASAQQVLVPIDESRTLTIPQHSTAQPPPRAPTP